MVILVKRISKLFSIIISFKEKEKKLEKLLTVSANDYNSGIIHQYNMALQRRQASR